MSFKAHRLARDRADLAFAVAHGLPTFIVEAYAAAMRDLAADLISPGC